MHTQTITIRYIYICVYLSIYGGSRCETKVRTLKGIRHYCCSVSVCVCGIPLQGVKIAFRARYVVYNTRQAVVKQHSSYVIAYDSQLVLVRKRIKGDFCAYL